MKEEKLRMMNRRPDDIRLLQEHLSNQEEKLIEEGFHLEGFRISNKSRVTDKANGFNESRRTLKRLFPKKQKKKKKLHNELIHLSIFDATTTSHDHTSVGQSANIPEILNYEREVPQELLKSEDLEFINDLNVVRWNNEDTEEFIKKHIELNSGIQNVIRTRKEAKKTYIVTGFSSISRLAKKPIVQEACGDNIPLIKMIGLIVLHEAVVKYGGPKICDSLKVPHINHDVLIPPSSCEAANDSELFEVLKDLSSNNIPLILSSLKRNRIGRIQKGYKHQFLGVLEKIMKGSKSEADLILIDSKSLGTQEQQGQ